MSEVDADSAISEHAKLHVVNQRESDRCGNDPRHRAGREKATITKRSQARLQCTRWLSAVHGPLNNLNLIDGKMYPATKPPNSEDQNGEGHKASGNRGDCKQCDDFATGHSINEDRDNDTANKRQAQKYYVGRRKDQEQAKDRCKDQLRHGQTGTVGLF